jgi:methionyl-tRNA synthetase
VVLSSKREEIMAELKPQIAYEDFAKLDIRIGTVAEATVHPNADKLLVVKVDMGDHVRQLVAGIRGTYQPEDLLGKQVVVLANLAPRVVRGTESQGMILAASETAEDGTKKVFVLTPGGPLKPGSPVS